MTEAKPITLDTRTALLVRQDDPIHESPPAQPLGADVTLLLRGKVVEPEIVISDQKHNFIWRVAMTPGDQPQTWTATVKMPSVPTVVRYHFEFADGTTFFALRQIEALIPETPNPTFGVWTRRPFQIAVYNPAAMPAKWTHGQLIYQIFPDRFARSETMAPREFTAQNVHGRPRLMLDWDQPPEIPPKGRDFYGGNLLGILEKLDYLCDLGVDCVYLTPIFESPSNHRYDAMNYFSIDPLLGSEADLQALADGTHERGMKLMLDIVFNHCSNDSKYFNQAGWYGEDVGAYRNRHSPYYRLFTFVHHPAEYQGWVGVPTMPEFVECPEHEDYFLGKDGVIDYWSRVGVDGWRTDVTPWMSDEFWRRVRRSIHALNPTALLVAEEWNDASHYLVGDSYDATMNYRFNWALRGFFALDVLTVEEFDERLENLRRDTPPPALLSQVNLLSSHDTARLLTVCDGDINKVWQMMAFLLAYPGSPMLYYGEELGLEGAFAEDGRRPFPWSGGDTQTQSFFRRALAYRRESNALRLGDYERVHVDEATRTYAFLRRLGDEQVIAVFNAGDTTADLALPLGDSAGINWRDALGINPDATLKDGRLQMPLAPRSGSWYVSG
jgi:cyclomaltodextrinase / maltogenic alpha-amylase / neopullulanase